jgi:hypothetical protein
MSIQNTTGFLIFFLIVSISGCQSHQKENSHSISDFSKLIQKVPKTSVLSEDGYYVWGGSVVKGMDEKYHMFYARWKKEHYFNGWVTHSEIAHAVADRPEGPFQFMDVALPARGAQYWDGLCTHNPSVKEFDGKYYLYYMGNTGDGIASANLNYSHRNNQRIGVAWADNPNGPWHRSNRPFVDVSKDEMADDALMTSNPSVTQMRDGKFLVVYKAVAKHKPLPFGGPVTHLAAIAETPMGPIKKYNKRIFYKEGEMFPAEDPFVWYDESADVYYGIVKDMHGTFTGEGVSLAFFKSDNGFDWKPAANALASKLEFTYEDGAVQKVARLERAQVLLEDEFPRMLYCASTKGDPFTSETFNVHIPLKKESSK